VCMNNNKYDGLLFVSHLTEWWMESRMLPGL
jgi:hypothetical protein